MLQVFNVPGFGFRCGYRANAGKLAPVVGMQSPKKAIDQSDRLSSSTNFSGDIIFGSFVFRAREELFGVVDFDELS